MSRGRKSKQNYRETDWVNLFNRNIGYYLQVILVQLGTTYKKSKESHESSKVLFERITKKTKPKVYPEIKDIKVPFKLPDNWIWCRLGEICTKIGSGSTPRGSNYANSGVPFFRSQNIYNQGLIYDDIKFISHTIHDQMKGTAVLSDDILLNITGGSMGRCAVVPSNFDVGNISQHVCIIRPCDVNNAFFHKITLSPFFQNAIFSSTTGAGREGLPKNKLEQFLVPLPPLTEQENIVNFLSDLEKNNLKSNGCYFDSYIEQKVLSLHKSQLASANISTELTHQLSLVQQLRRQFLQEAAQGKLVPQNPEDEPASVLLQKIKAEKERLVREKKIKKDKDLLPIKAEEVPFEVPEGWVWCRLGEIVNQVFDGPFGSHLKTADYTKSGIQVIRLENLGEMKFKANKQTFISESKYETIKQHTVYEGDILIGSFLSDGVKCVLLPKLSGTSIAKADCFCIRIGNSLVHKEFMMFLLSSQPMFLELSQLLRGMTRLRINTTQLKNLPIPLPPLPEQHRIVEKLEQLMQTCDALEASIRESRGYNEQLLQQVLREALQGA